MPPKQESRNAKPKRGNKSNKRQKKNKAPRRRPAMRQQVTNIAVSVPRQAQRTEMKNSGSSRVQRVRATEVLGPLTSPSTVQIGVNPVLWTFDPTAAPFHRLAAFAAMYQKYKVHSCRFRYVPACPATDNGQIMAAIMYDTAVGVETLASDADFLNAQDHRYQAIWKPFDLSVNVKSLKAPWFYTGATVTEPTGYDSRWEAPFAIATSITGTSGSGLDRTYGMLFIDYDVEFVDYIDPVQTSISLVVDETKFSTVATNVARSIAFTHRDWSAPLSYRTENHALQNLATTGSYTGVDVRPFTVRIPPGTHYVAYKGPTVITRSPTGSAVNMNLKVGAWYRDGTEVPSGVVGTAFTYPNAGGSYSFNTDMVVKVINTAEAFVSLALVATDDWGSGTTIGVSGGTLQITRADVNYASLSAEASQPTDRAYYDLPSQSSAAIAAIQSGDYQCAVLVELPPQVPDIEDCHRALLARLATQYLPREPVHMAEPPSPVSYVSVSKRK